MGAGRKGAVVGRERVGLASSKASRSFLKCYTCFMYALILHG